MATFEHLEWLRLDVWAIVGAAGIATVLEARSNESHDWLLAHGYEITSVDCSPGLADVVPALGRLLRWEEQFGYCLKSDSRNLDALRDGFQFHVPAEGGRVFELVRPDILWEEDPRWLLGLLAIASEYSRWQLALGRRFFTLLVLPPSSPLIGHKVDELTVPWPI